MSTFDPNWPHGHVTRDGLRARVIADNIENPHYAIVALVVQENGHQFASFFRNDGLHIAGDRSLDLVNAPPPRQSVWMNVYSTDEYYASRDEAIRGRNSRARGQIEIVFEGGRPVDVKLHRDGDVHA